ncbi:MAG: C40 family peptidase [Methylobacter sp.]|nr:C40 family peptidase [Methylobacter sp.]
MKSSLNKSNGFFCHRFILSLVIVLFSGCASVPEIKPAAQPVTEYALSLQGIAYQYGKDSPAQGFDCSGFVKHVYERYGVLLPRTAQEMARSLPQIPNSNLHAGDLVFFNIDGGAFSHVGIYIDNNSFIHAPSRRTGKVLVSSLKNPYWHRRFIGARRP